MIGCISAELINDDLFLANVQNGQGEEVRLHLENIVGRFLLQYISQKLDGGGSRRRRVHRSAESPPLREGRIPPPSRRLLTEGYRI